MREYFYYGIFILLLMGVFGFIINFSWNYIIEEMGRAIVEQSVSGGMR